jgi:ribonuclease-3 family protein
MALAYLGDAVFELAIRHEMIQRGHIKLHDLNKQTSTLCHADAQAKAVLNLAEVLTEEEAEWLRRVGMSKVSMLHADQPCLNIVMQRRSKH